MLGESIRAELIPFRLLLRGWIHYSAGRFRTLFDLKAALEIDGNNADTLLLLTNCYPISGQVSAARPLIEHALSLDPLNPVTRCMPGFVAPWRGTLPRQSSRTGRCAEMDPRKSDGAAVLRRRADPQSPH